MTSVLVTGAGGYIGQRLTRHLVGQGVTVRALTRFAVDLPDGVEQLVGDLAGEPGLAKDGAQGMDVAVHLAGANEVAIAEDPDGSVAETVSAARQLADSGIGRIIYFSTVHVYGAALAPGAVVTEDTTPEPTHPYGGSRLACEEVFAQSGVPSLLFRLTNGVGAPTRPDVDRWSLVANELCREGAVHGRLTLRTPGVQWRDFVALRDVESVVAVLVSGRGPAAAVPTGVCNLASGNSVTIRALAGVVQDSFEAHGEPRPPLLAPDAPADSPGPYRVDTSRLASLGLSTGTTLRQAIDETVTFCLTNRSALR